MRSFPRAVFFVVTVLAGVSTGQPSLTMIEDILFKADSSRFNGQIEVQWNSFEAADASNIATHFLRVRVVNGLLRVKLVPTTNASSGAHYKVTYVSDGKVQFTEFWHVPPSSSTLRVRDVRAAQPPGPSLPPPPSTQVQISDVIGLTNELSIRPAKGLNFIPFRAAIINSTGEIEGAIGDVTDCVRVDGTSGPCGTGGGGGGSGATFVDGETPAGVVNGINLNFVLSQAPNPASSLELYRNGLLQKSGSDYSISGRDVTFTVPSIPVTGDTILAFYRISPMSSAGPQVLCAGAGTSTTGASLTTLAACVIPGGLLQPGDRVEAAADYSHEGNTIGFSFEIRWGQAVVVSRSTATTEIASTARIDSSIGNPNNYLSFSSWGNSLSHATGLVTAAPDLSQPLTIEFLGSMASAGSESVTLRNLRVVRYSSVP